MPSFASPLPVAAPDSVGFSTESLNRLDGAMQAEIDAGHYAGISVMVARHGHPRPGDPHGITRMKKAQ
jgi:hypothetical protein